MKSRGHLTRKQHDRLIEAHRAPEERRSLPAPEQHAEAAQCASDRLPPHAPPEPRGESARQGYRSDATTTSDAPWEALAAAAACGGLSPNPMDTNPDPGAGPDAPDAPPPRPAVVPRLRLRATLRWSGGPRLLVWRARAGTCLCQGGTAWKGAA